MNKHTVVLCVLYSLISCHHGEGGVRDRREVLCLLLLLRSVFLWQGRVGLRRFVFWRQKRRRDRLGPTPPRLFTSFWLRANTHTDTSYTAQTHSLTPAYSSLSKGGLLRLRLSLLPLPPEGSSANKGKQACFCLGRRPQAIPHHGFIQHK